MKAVIWAAYYWFYHTVCRLPQPFTYYLRLSANHKGGLIAWLGGAWLAGALYINYMRVQLGGHKLKIGALIAGLVGAFLIGAVLGHLFWQ